MNMESDKTSMLQAIMIQENLIKFRMGFPVDRRIELLRIDVDDMEAQIISRDSVRFEPSGLLAYKMFMNRQRMLDLQYRAAVYETFPTLSLGAT